MSKTILVEARPARTYEIPDELWELGMEAWTDPERCNYVQAEADLTKWFLESHSQLLGGKTPVEMLQEEGGYERVKQVLGAILYGVYL